jgi:hypothetical protein
MTPAQFFIKQLTHPWWWAPNPPWAYHYNTDKDRGWFKVDHPGMFNLMWVSTGITGTDVAPYAGRAWWALIDGDRLRLSGYTLADHAMTLSLTEFHDLLRHNRNDLLKLDFSGDMTGGQLLVCVERRRAHA